MRPLRCNLFRLCPFKEYPSQISHQALDLSVLRSFLSSPPDKSDAVPPSVYTEGPLADLAGVHCDEGDAFMYLSFFFLQERTIEEETSEVCIYANLTSPPLSMISVGWFTDRPISRRAGGYRALDWGRYHSWLRPAANWMALVYPRLGAVNPRSLAGPVYYETNAFIANV